MDTMDQKQPHTVMIVPYRSRTVAKQKTAVRIRGLLHRESNNMPKRMNNKFKEMVVDLARLGSSAGGGSHPAHQKHAWPS